jgi:hypothetical protein
MHPPEQWILGEMVKLQKVNSLLSQPKLKIALVSIFGTLTFWKLTISASIKHCFMDIFFWQPVTHMQRVYIINKAGQCGRNGVGITGS